MKSVTIVGHLEMVRQKVGHIIEYLQCEAPQSCFLVSKSPSNYSYVRTINHSYWSYVHQLSYRTGASHCSLRSY